MWRHQRAPSPRAFHSRSPSRTVREKGIDVFCPNVLYIDPTSVHAHTYTRARAPSLCERAHTPAHRLRDSGRQRSFPSTKANPGGGFGTNSITILQSEILFLGEKWWIHSSCFALGTHSRPFLRGWFRRTWVDCTYLRFYELGMWNIRLTQARRARRHEPDYSIAVSCLLHSKMRRRRLESQLGQSRRAHQPCFAFRERGTRMPYRFTCIELCRYRRGTAKSLFCLFVCY